MPDFTPSNYPALGKKERRAASHKAWVARNREKVNAINRRWAIKHAAAIRIQRRGYRENNKDKLRAANKAWRLANAEYASVFRTNSHFKSTGSIDEITLERYQRLLKQQKGVCAICRKMEVTAITKRLAIDHDHATGRVRGLLCYKCNSGLGFFNDDLKVLKKAISYVRRAREMAKRK